MHSFITRLFGILLPLVLLSAPALSASDLSLSPTLQAELSALLNLDEPMASQLTPGVSADIDMYGDAGPATAEASLFLSGTDSTLQLQRLRADWYPSDMLQISLGRFSEDWSPSLALPAAVLFTPHTIPGDIPLDGFQGSATPWRLEATYFLDFGYARLHYSPDTPDFQLPQEDSPWFPTELVPKIISLRHPFDGRLTWELEAIDLLNPRPEPALGTPSAAAELGGSFSHFDIALIGYYGWNGRLMISQNTELKREEDGTPIDYTMAVYPVYSRHFLAALHSTGSVGQFWWWIEAAAAPHTRVPLSRTAAEDTTGPAALFSGTAGLGWFLPAGYGQLLLESTYQHIQSDLPVLHPTFDRAAAAAIELTPPLEGLSLRTAALLEYPDYGLALTGEIRYQAHPQLSFSISGATFFSSYGAFLYSYRDNHLVRLNTELQF